MPVPAIALTPIGTAVRMVSLGWNGAALARFVQSRLESDLPH
jgi:hypothetical protein